MKYIVLFTIFTVVAAVDYYKLRSDIDMMALAAKPGGLKPLIDCLLDKGPCSELGASYKDKIPESTKQICARCTDEQKHQYWYFLVALNKTMPEGYTAYRQHFDPENKYFAALEKELSKFA